MMNLSTILFYVISCFMLSAGILAVTSRKIFRAAIWLLFSLVGIAALYFWMQVEFIAAVQIIVYVGGIAVLIIFSVFLTQEPGKQMPGPVKKRNIFSLLAAIFGLAFSTNLFARYPFPGNTSEPFVVSVDKIGTQMLSTSDHGYILPFEVVSMLLLASMVGCIVIAMKPPVEKQPGISIAAISKEPETPGELPALHPPISEPSIAGEL